MGKKTQQNDKDYKKSDTPDDYDLTPVHVPGRRGRKPGSKNREKNNEGNKITNFDPEYLLDRYFPLRKAVFNKFYSRFPTPDKQQELAAQIDLEFMQLIQEYDMSRGVDFPYYIQRMLNFRMWHFIEKTDKLRSNETTVDGSSFSYSIFVDDDIEQPANLNNSATLMDSDSERKLEIVEALNSIPVDVMDIPLHEYLIKGVLAEGKSLEEIAEHLDMSMAEITKEFNSLCSLLHDRAVEKQRRVDIVRIPIITKEENNGD